MTRIPLILLAVLVVGACASSDRSSSDESRASGNSLNDMLDRGLADKRRREPAPDLGAGAGRLPPGWAVKIDRWWGLWREGDERWPEARADWVALGSGAENILVENLIRWYILAYDEGQRFEVNRAQRELTDFVGSAAPILAVGLGQGLGDGVVRNRLVDLVTSFGSEAAPILEDAFQRSNATKGQAALVRAVGRIGDERSVDFLIDAAADDDHDFSIRIEAIKWLGEMGSARATRPLVDLLRDDDPSVRKFAAHYVSATTEPTEPVLTALIDCMERAQNDGQTEVERACRKSLARLVGRDLGSRPRDWRAVVRGDV